MKWRGELPVRYQRTRSRAGSCWNRCTGDQQKRFNPTRRLRAVFTTTVLMLAFAFPGALGAQARSDSLDVAIAALDSTRSRHPSGSTAVIRSGDRLLEETVARRLGFAVDSTGWAPFVVKLSIERLSLFGDSAELVVESTVRLEPRRVYVEVATIKLSRARGAWRISSLRRDSIT